MIQPDTLQQYLHQLPPKYEAVNTTDIDAASECSQKPNVDVVSEESERTTSASSLNLPSPAQVLGQVLTQPSVHDDKTGRCEPCAQPLTAGPWNHS